MSTRKRGMEMCKHRWVHMNTQLLTNPPQFQVRCVDCGDVRTRFSWKPVSQIETMGTDEIKKMGYR